MIEYPSIIGPSKAPRKPCVAFEKFDGSNIRAKYSSKSGFTTFGSRTQIIDASHPNLGQVLGIFNETFQGTLTRIFKDKFPNERDIVIFGEFFGPNSFAGIHQPDDPKRFVLFDVLFVRKTHQLEFLGPREFVKTFEGQVDTPRVIYEGNFNEQLISDVREGVYDVDEGVVAKGVERNGAYRGKTWMAKIKTKAYLDKLRTRFGNDWTKYAE